MLEVNGGDWIDTPQNATDTSQDAADNMLRGNAAVHAIAAAVISSWWSASIHTQQGAEHSLAGNISNACLQWF
jgi:hypothetical protein